MSQTAMKTCAEVVRPSSKDGHAHQRIDALDARIGVLESYILGLYHHLGLERVKIIEETWSELREVIQNTRVELRKISPAKKGA